MELPGHLAIMGIAATIGGLLWLKDIRKAYRESHRT